MLNKPERNMDMVRRYQNIRVGGEKHIKKPKMKETIVRFEKGLVKKIHCYCKR